MTTSSTTGVPRASNTVRTQVTNQPPALVGQSASDANAAKQAAAISALDDPLSAGVTIEHQILAELRAIRMVLSDMSGKSYDPDVFLN